MPELEDLTPLLGEIWASKQVTNNAQFAQQLEVDLTNYLGVPTVGVLNSGTAALMIALKMFDLPPGSEVVTTPMTFPATANAIAWNGLTPVFADVLEDYLTLDPEAVRLAITPRTSAILAVHVYGTVCDVDALQKIANEHELKLIYDAAHVFGAEYRARPISSFGDASAFSFHATKLFTTIEGGALATPRESDGERIRLLRNFGIKNENEIDGIGLNGKLNEIQAAIGILNLRAVGAEKSRREKLRSLYNEYLDGIGGLSLPPVQIGATSSEQYYRVLIAGDGEAGRRDRVYDELKRRSIFARKYFHPLCTDSTAFRSSPIVSLRDQPVVSKAKFEVLCLPFHSGVSEQDVAEIAEVIRSAD